MTVVDRDANTPLQDIFQHTFKRILEIENSDVIKQIFMLRDLNGGTLNIQFFAGLGPDGSSGEGPFINNITIPLEDGWGWGSNN